MKDIRFIQLKDGKIAVFSRPQGGNAGRGKVGFFIINSFEELTHKLLFDAPFLNLFSDLEWGGVNQVRLMENGDLGVIGHIAKMNRDDSLHYYPMMFTINPKTKEHSGVKILFRRDDLQKGESKNKRLRNVLFPGGFVDNLDGTIEIYAGAGDAEVYRVKIKNPFEN